MIDILNTRSGNEFSKQNSLFINKNIDLILFELLINNAERDMLKKVTSMLNNMDYDRTVQSFTLLINDYPVKNIRPIKHFMYDYIIKIKPHYFITHNPVKSKVLAKSWSAALIKLENKNIKPAEILYKALLKVNDAYACSLVILENKDLIPKNEYYRFLDLIKFDRPTPLNSNLSSKNCQQTISEAINYLQQ